MSTAANYSAHIAVVDGIEVLQLADAARHTEVSIAPSIGNIAYELKVNGKNAFWLPSESLAELKAKPAMCGNPFLAPWANRLDQDAFFANGKKFRLNPDLGNIRRDQNQHPIHGLLTVSPDWEVTALESDAHGHGLGCMIFNARLHLEHASVQAIGHLDGVGKRKLRH